ncbi:hypothetical protein, partial [Paludibacter sp.]|uniref:hypothetical protein n=1 Tax=Paludibacter sp. TaxID=1898105 RepID=UPI0025CCC2DC
LFDIKRTPHPYPFDMCSVISREKTEVLRSFIIPSEESPHFCCLLILLFPGNISEIGRVFRNAAKNIRNFSCSDIKKG